MTELYETVTKAHKHKEAKLHEMKVKEEKDKRGQLKDVQLKFVDYFTKMVESKIREVSENPKYVKTFVDVLQFSLPPKKSEEQIVDFEGYLLIELMEGPEECNYTEHFKASDTEPTIDLLRKACAPLSVHYGYYYKFGNVIQVRWDDVVPGWALSEPAQFELKKAASLKNKQNPRNQNNRSKWQNKPTIGLKNPFDMMRQMYTMSDGPRPNRYNTNNPTRNANNQNYVNNTNNTNNPNYNNNYSNRTSYNNRNNYNNRNSNGNNNRYNNGNNYNNQVRQRAPMNRKYSRGPVSVDKLNNTPTVDIIADISTEVETIYEVVE